MRDFVVTLFIAVWLPFAIASPWLGVILLAILDYLNPHRYAWGFSREMPFYFIAVIVTGAALVFTKDRWSVPRTRETGLLAALLFMFTITTALAYYPTAAWEQWIKVLKIMVPILLTMMLINTRDKVFYLVLAIALSFGLIGLKGGIWWLSSGGAHRVYGPSGTQYGDNNHIGLALNMALPLLVASIRQADSRWLKTFLKAVFGFTIVAIVGTYSRGAFVTLGAVLFLLLITSRHKILAALMLVVGLSFITDYIPDQWFSRMESIQEYEQDHAAMGRIRAWEDGVRIANDRPLTGGGFGAFAGAWTGSHSGYIGILGEHGYPTLAVWLSLLFGTMWALGRLRRQAAGVPDLAWVQDYARMFQVSLAAYAVGGAFLNVGYWGFFYHLVGMTAILKVLARQRAVVQEVPHWAVAGQPGTAAPEGLGVLDPASPPLPDRPRT